MTVTALEMFLSSSYNIMADVKMWYFFADISKTALVVLAVLFGLSIVVRNFWCRYLCPYGALLGITSLLSPNKIKRNVDSCIDCALCAKACPSRIKVDKVKTVISDECSTCMSCVDICPVANTLELKSVATNERIPKKAVAIGVVTIFMFVTGVAIFTGHWYNEIPNEVYIQNFENINSLGHPRSIGELEKLNKGSVDNKEESKSLGKQDTN
jgi:polyferredoxin